MSKNFQTAIGIVLVVTAFAHAQNRVGDTANKSQGGQVVQSQPAGRAVPSAAPWVVSIVHKVDSHKFIEHVRKEQNRRRIGVPGSLPEFFFNITTGAVIDDKGHIVTRLATLLDPQDKEQNIAVVTGDGLTIQAKFIGLDCASGFTVLEVPNLTVKLPNIAENLSQNKFVKILSADFVQQVAVNDNRQGVYVAPEIRTMSGQVEASNLYAKERGVWMLRSAGLRSKNDSAVVMTVDNQLLGLARYSGFGRADLFPIAMIRDLIASRVIEKHESIPAGWLGIVGVNVSQLSPADASAWDLNTKAGVVAREVNPESPAGQNGIKQGDVIVALDDTAVASTGELAALLSTMPAGRKVKLKILRQQEPLEITVALGARAYTEPVFALEFTPAADTGPAQRDALYRRRDELIAQYRAYLNEKPRTQEIQEALNELGIEIRAIYDQIRAVEQTPGTTDGGITADQVRREPVSKEQVSCTLPAGFTVSEMTTQLAAYLGSPKSLLVKSVKPGSAAEAGGLKAADVIIGTTQEPLSCAQLEGAFANTPDGVTLNVIRNKQPLSISVNAKH